VFNPALDVWIWITCLALLGVLGARAWVVETGQGRLGRTPAKVQVLTAASAGVLVLLVVLVAVQGGALLVNSILTGTDPLVAGSAGAPVDPAAVDPAAVPVDPNAPAAPAGG
jgi:hypothetical protein